MTRSIPPNMAGILSRLELERPELVTMADMQTMAEAEGLSTPARIVASRLRKHGWLLATSQRGVWEFAPAELAGAYSGGDPLIDLKAFLVANPRVACALTFQTAAWAQGLANRMPARIEVAFKSQPKVKLPNGIASSVYEAHLPLMQAKGVPTLAPESTIIHMAQRPSAVRSWSSAAEWLPDVAYELSYSDLLIELEGRPASVWARIGYLLQGMRPDITDALEHAFTPRTKVRFGTATNSLRNDERWKVTDTMLPFDPRHMEAVK